MNSLFKQPSNPNTTTTTTAPNPTAGEKSDTRSVVVGDGGSSWRLKALKRAHEQGEGQKFQDVVEERPGSMGKFVASRSVAPTHDAHLHAIKRRRMDQQPTKLDKDTGEKTEPAPLIGLTPGDSNKEEESGAVKPVMSANQLAAKALQLRMKGKHEEAETLMKEAEKIKAIQSSGEQSSGWSVDGTTSRIIMHDVSARQKKKEEDADTHLANRIIHNHRYSVSGQADEEYDYDDGPRRKTLKQTGDCKSSEINNSSKRILTQQERCLFCFDNPSRPKHQVISIANFTYLSLPQRQSVVPGHCGILTLQHELSSRSVDDNVWDEIRNFKKCLIMMFDKQDKEVVFLETVMGLGQQKRHCMVECVPLPRQIAKQAPAYFKKAIDEVEDEWSQHSAKKLIDTSEKGLRASIPKNFPYFHVEFGLKKGFVHVIDNEKEFDSKFGIKVITNILRLSAEDSQRQCVASFMQKWESFDWTKTG